MSEIGPMLGDAEARRAIREDLDATLVVEAAAGTGKTTEMIARIIAVIASGVTVLERLVAVTFTEKAAGEMKLRLRTELERAREAATGLPRERLEGALAALEVARIGSIHSFCADLLRERPIEARVDPLFEVAAEDETERLYDQAFETWFQRTLANPPEGVRRILRRREPTEQLRKAGFSLVDRRDFDGAWRRDPFERDAAIDHTVNELATLAAYLPLADKPTTYPALLFAKLQHWLDELARREQVRARDHDGLEAELAELFRWYEWKPKGYGAVYGGSLTKGDVIARRDAVRAELEQFLQLANADLAACLHAELVPLVAEYEGIKSRTGRLDFLDLLANTRDLLRDDAQVRREMQARYTHFFIDEFQDTDPLQVEIVLLLCANDPAIADAAQVVVQPGKLFVVGDPKQAIYRFRRADIALYESVKERLVRDGATLLHLTTSFRAVPSIQTAINAAFAPIMTGDGQAHYVPLARHRDDAPGQPAIVALPVPKPYGKRDIANTAIEESYPDAVAAFIDFLIRRSGWTVQDRAGVRVAIDSQHVCLMFRRFQTFGRDLTRPYVRALEARGLAHVLVGGRSFHDREEIEAARNALRAIEWPDDEFSVYATLRGPLFSFHDEDLVAFRHTHQRVDPIRWIETEPPAEHADIAAALRILGELHRKRNRRAIADTITRLLAATRAHAAIAIWPAGEQALANLFRVIDLARRFESVGATSFRAFIARLDRDAERGRQPDAPVVEEGTEGVRIMTVHKAKGLEFPVVILCDPTAPLEPSEPSHHVVPERRLWLERLAGCVPSELREHADEVIRRDREEEQRLAYVAVTRARDLVVVPVVGDDERSGWLESLAPVIYPSPATKRAPAQAPSCPPFGDDSVVERHHPDRLPHDSVAPGLHVPRAGAHTVVWWDPHVLDLGADAVGGLRQSQILEADASNELAHASIEAHARWQERRARTLIDAATPSLKTISVTDASRTAPPGGMPVAIEHTRIDRVNRPNSRRFGSLVHAVLAAIELRAADAAHVRAVTINQARLLGGSTAEIEAAITAVRAAVAHPLMQRAVAASALRREIPIVLDTRDVMLEGIIDLAFCDGTAWVVVDYKTDPELAPEIRAPYEAQVRSYATAITAATGLPCAAALFLV
jgi:ATP-dependent exoDNAse (exonuclease V) beta subunit